MPKFKKGEIVLVTAGYKGAFLGEVLDAMKSNWRHPSAEKWYYTVKPLERKNDFNAANWWEEDLTLGEHLYPTIVWKGLINEI